MITYLLNKKLCIRLHICICVFTIYISSIIIDMTLHDQPTHHPEGDEALVVTLPVVALVVALDVILVAVHRVAHGGAHVAARCGAHGVPRGRDHCVAHVLAPGVACGATPGGVGLVVVLGAAPIPG